MRLVALCALVLIVAAAPFLAESDAGKRPPDGARLSNLPRIVLWAWERREDLSFINPDKIAVAYLARTLTLAGDEIVVRPRFQPLTVSPRTRLIAVVRVETDLRHSPSLSEAQAERAATVIAQLTLTSPAAIQIDFDATHSQRRFYRSLVVDLRRQMPTTIPISITALASWCFDDDWISNLPVDEAVPMIYRMGPDAKVISTYLHSGEELGPAISRSSIGLSLDEDLAGYAQRKRVYLFSPAPWTPRILRSALENIAQ